MNAPAQQKSRLRRWLLALCAGVALPALAGLPALSHSARFGTRLRAAVLRLTLRADDDGDGYAPESAGGRDCDDTNAAVHPGATELCNGLDDDCDGATDEADAADASTWHADADGDGYGDPDTTATACAAPAGYLSDGTDCDDGDAAQHPGATEVCDDGIDNDCTGLMDCEELSCEGASACHESDCADGADDDGDGATDCADDDCWGAACARTVARVTGGRMGVHSAFGAMGYDKTSVCGGSFGEDFFKDFASIDSVTGTVQVALGTGAPVETCTWSVSHVALMYKSRQFHSRKSEFTEWTSVSSSGSECTFKSSSDGTVTSDATPTRSGFDVDPACGLSTSGFLPPAFKPRSRALPATWQTLAGASWYTGVPVKTSSTFSTSWGIPSEGSDETREFYVVSPLLSGETYITDP